MVGKVLEYDPTGQKGKRGRCEGGSGGREKKKRKRRNWGNYFGIVGEFCSRSSCTFLNPNSVHSTTHTHNPVTTIVTTKFHLLIAWLDIMTQPPPAFNLTELDHKLLAMSDADFVPHDWADLKDIIGR